MPSLDINFADILARLRVMDRRLLALMAAGVILSLYLAFLGFQYWGEVQRNQGFLAEEQTLLRTITAAGRVAPPPAAELEAATAQWELMAAQYTYGHPDEIYPAVTAAATRARVNVTSISNSPSGNVVHDGLRYDVHRVNLRVSGSLNNIQGFIVELGTVAPVTVSSINLSGLEQEPTANLTVSLTTNPRPASGGR